MSPYAAPNPCTAYACSLDWELKPGDSNGAGSSPNAAPKAGSSDPKAAKLVSKAAGAGGGGGGGTAGRGCDRGAMMPVSRMCSVAALGSPPAASRARWACAWSQLSTEASWTAAVLSTRALGGDEVAGRLVEPLVVGTHCRRRSRRRSRRTRHARRCRFGRPGKTGCRRPSCLFPGQTTVLWTLGVGARPSRRHYHQTRHPLPRLAGRCGRRASCGQRKRWLLRLAARSGCAGRRSGPGAACACAEYNSTPGRPAAKSKPARRLPSHHTQQG
eukprot:scaffold30388_cov95-Isochrysis_galbana.AAC.1